MLQSGTATCSFILNPQTVSPGQNRAANHRLLNASIASQRSKDFISRRFDSVKPAIALTKEAILEHIHGISEGQNPEFELCLKIYLDTLPA